IAPKLRRRARRFTNAILPHRTPVVNRNSWVRGAVSFRRWLGCAQKVIARVRPRRARRGALAAAHLASALGCPGWTDARIPPQPSPPRATGLSFGERLRSERPRPTDADIVEGAGHVGGCSTKEVLWPGLRSLTDCA